eukprot:2911160-Alexandrium_andersonii.AAC.1
MLTNVRDEYIRTRPAPPSASPFDLLEQAERRVHDIKQSIIDVDSELRFLEQQARDAYARRHQLTDQLTAVKANRQ